MELYSIWHRNGLHPLSFCRRSWKLRFRRRRRGGGYALHGGTLSKISMEMLADINKDTVDFQPNFDETEREPKVVLPSRFPNLLGERNFRYCSRYGYQYSASQS